jgi:hypothetical protein
VITRSGDKIEFAVYGATIENDTLHAIGQRAPIAIPTDSIARVSSRKFSWTKTAGLTVGVSAVAFCVLFVTAFNNLGKIK